jgi:hypothetical protein
MLVEIYTITVVIGVQQSRILAFMIMTYSGNLAKYQVFSTLYLEHLGLV